MKKRLFLLLLFSSIIIDSNAQTGWAWMTGKNGANGPAVFGVQGVADSANTPSSLYEPAEWSDQQGNFWLFGGMLSSLNPMSALWKFDPTITQWTWIGGSSSCCELGIYGTQGVPDPNNHPGARKWAAATWTDLNGNLWLFGGYGYDVNGGYSDMNDLWKYDIIASTWTWMKGSNNTGSNGSYGTLGVSSPTNEPPCRHECAARWVDDAGNLWLFGGLDQTYNPLNDLWKYDMLTGEWTWMNGSNLPGQPATYGIKGVPSPTNNPGARECYQKWKDSQGNFWMFGGYTIAYPLNDLWKFDPISLEWTWMNGPPLNGDPGGNYSVFCDADTSNVPKARYENRASWIDANDRLWFFGGYTNTDNMNDLWYFDINSGEWNWLSGSNGNISNGVYGTLGVPDPANYPGGRSGSVGWMDSDCNKWMFGGANFSNGKYYNDLWKYVADSLCVGGNCFLLFPSALFSTTDTALCETTCIDFFDLSGGSPTSWQWSFPGAIPSSSTDQNPTNICYDSSGTYDVTLIVTNAAGTDTIVTSSFITVNAAPSVSISQSGNVLSSSSASSYQWYLNNLIIPGASSQSYNATQSGIYTIEVTDSNGCSASADIFFSAVALSSSDTTLCEKFCIDFFDLSFNSPVSWQWIFPGANPTSSSAQNPANICYDDPGVFDVTLITTDANGVADTLILDDYITVYQNPFAPTITQSGNILTSSPADSYQWQLNGLDIPGATNQDYQITESGLYTVIITDANGCVAQSSVKAEYVGIDDVVGNSTVNVYPNPSSGNFTVECFNCLIGELISIKVINTLGQEIFSSSEKITSSNFQKTIYLTRLPAGVYHLKLETENYLFNLKIILAN